MTRIVYKRPEYIVREQLRNVILNFGKGRDSGDITSINLAMVESVNFVSRTNQRPLFATLDMPSRDDPNHMPALVTDTTSA